MFQCQALRMVYGLRMMQDRRARGTGFGAISLHPWNQLGCLGVEAPPPPPPPPPPKNKKNINAGAIIEAYWGPIA